VLYAGVGATVAGVIIVVASILIYKKCIKKPKPLNGRLEEQSIP
jgi:hypothetical protein